MLSIHQVLTTTMKKCLFFIRANFGKEKKRSFFSEIKRASGNHTKNSSVTATSFDRSLYDLEAPESLENPQQHLEEFGLFWRTSITEIASSLHQAKQAKIPIAEIRIMLTNKMRAHFDDYLARYSHKEKQFLIVSFVIDEWLVIFELFSQDNPTQLANFLNQKKEILILGWINYHTFKDYLSELETTFAPLWNDVEQLLFGN